MAVTGDKGQLRGHIFIIIFILERDNTAKEIQNLHGV